MHPNLIHYNRYIDFISSRKLRKIPKDTYTENHHIIPRSLGGNNQKYNRITLTAKEHFISHMILWKAYGGSMTHAFWFMTNNKREHSFYITSRQYEILKEQLAKEVSICHTGDIAHNRNKLMINNGKENLFILEEQLEDYEILGYRKGKYSLYKKEGTTRNKICINNGSKNKFIHIDNLNNWENKGWIKGMKSSYIHHTTVLNKITIHKNNKNKFITPEDLDSFILKGWNKGGKSLGRPSKEIINKMKKTKKDNPQKNTNKNRLWMNNGIKNRMIKPKEVNQYKNKGFILGRNCTTNII